MKSFEEYIGQASLSESRQKYIFGGTDDRNTDETSKTFGDLDVGDYLFWSDPISKKGERVRIHKRAIADIELIKGIHVYTLQPFGERVVPNIYMEDRYYVNDFKNCKMVYAKMVYATNVDDFLKVVNDISGVTHTEDNIILVEANQNYIFGGTDNRNTNAGVMLDDLKVGDLLYFYYTKDEEYMPEKCKILDIKTLKKIVKFYTYDGVYADICVNKTNLSQQCAYNDMNDGIVSSDVDVFLETVNKISGKKFTKEDIIDFSEDEENKVHKVQ